MLRGTKTAPANRDTSEAAHASIPVKQARAPLIEDPVGSLPSSALATLATLLATLLSTLATRLTCALLTTLLVTLVGLLVSLLAALLASLLVLLILFVFSVCHNIPQRI